MPGSLDRGTAKTLFSLFIYVVLFNVIVLSSAIVLHEGGHYVAGTVFWNCSGEMILFDAEYLGPYTKLDCSHEINAALLYLSGFLLLVPFSLCFLLLRQFPEKHFFLVISGAAIFTAALDVQYLTGLGIFHAITMATGLGIYFLGEYFLTDRMFLRFEERGIPKGGVTG